MGRLKPRKRRRSRLKLGRESVFMHCSAGHHAVAIEGYLFVVFRIVDIIVQTILTCRNALQQDGRGYTSVFTIGPLGPCCMQHGPSGQNSFSFWGLSPPKPPPDLCPWTTLAHQGYFRSFSPPVPLAALSGNGCFSLSPRLCFSNDVSESWIHG